MSVTRTTADRTVIVDALRGVRPPFSPETVAYGINTVAADKYAGVWPLEQFGIFGIRYKASATPKSDLYVDLLPLINSRRIDLLDHPKSINQLCALERRTARGGGDSIDHPPNQHDDPRQIGGIAAINNQYNGFNLEHFLNWRR